MNNNGLSETVAARRVEHLSIENNDLTCPTRSRGDVEFVGEFRELTNLDNGRKPAKGFGRLVRPAHAAVARDLGFALTLGNSRDWVGFATVCASRLTLAERGGLAWAAMLTLPADILRQVAEAAAEAAVAAEGEADPFDTDHWRDGVAEHRASRRRAAQ